MNGVAAGDGELILWVPGNDIIELGILSAWGGLEIQETGPPRRAEPETHYDRLRLYYDYTTTGRPNLFGNLDPGIDHSTP